MGKIGSKVTVLPRTLAKLKLSISLRKRQFLTGLDQKDKDFIVHAENQVENFSITSYYGV